MLMGATGQFNVSIILHFCLSDEVLYNPDRFRNSDTKWYWSLILKHYHSCLLVWIFPHFASQRCFIFNLFPRFGSLLQVTQGNKFLYFICLHTTSAYLKKYPRPYKKILPKLLTKPDFSMRCKSTFNALPLNFVH